KLCVLDQAGMERSRWAAELEPIVTAALGTGGDQTPSVPSSFHLAGQVLAVHKITFHRQELGALVLAIPEATGQPERSAVRECLATLAGYVGPRLYMERRDNELASLRQELKEQTILANLGELAGPVAHESNNFLNVVLLQATLMEAELPEAMRDQLEVI